MMAVVLTDLAVCVAIDVFVRRLIVRKTDGSRHREKAMRFAVAARRFVFVWILGEWLPECLKADLEVLRPACAVLSVAAIALCAVMFSAAISWLIKAFSNLSLGSVTMV